MEISFENQLEENKENRSQDITIMEWILERILKPGSNTTPHIISLGPVGQNIEPQVIGRNDKKPLARHLLVSGIVSKTHCQLQLKNNVWTIEDRGSLNGTWVNSTKLRRDEQVIIKPGDKIGLGVQDWGIHTEESSYMFILTKRNIPMSPINPEANHDMKVSSSKTKKSNISKKDINRRQNSSKPESSDRAEVREILVIDDTDSDSPSPSTSNSSKLKQEQRSKVDPNPSKDVKPFRLKEGCSNIETDSKQWKRIKTFSSSGSNDEIDNLESEIQSDVDNDNITHTRNRSSLDFTAASHSPIRGEQYEPISVEVFDPVLPEIVNLYQEGDGDGNIELYTYSAINKKTEQKVLKLEYSEFKPRISLPSTSNLNQLQHSHLAEPHSSKKRKSDEAGFETNPSETNANNSKKLRNDAAEVVNSPVRKSEFLEDNYYEALLFSSDSETDTFEPTPYIKGNLPNSSSLSREQNHELHKSVHPSSSVLDPDSHRENTIDRVKEKMSKKPSNGIKFLSSALPIRTPRGNSGIQNFYPLGKPKDPIEPKRMLTSEEIKEERRRKLKKIADKDKQMSAGTSAKKSNAEKAPVKAKPGHSRCFELDVVQHSNSTLGPSVSEPAKGNFPLQNIMEKMDKQKSGRLSQILEKPVVSASLKVTGKTASEKYQSAMLKPGSKGETKIKPVLSSSEAFGPFQDNSRAQPNEPGPYIRPVFDPGPAPVFIGNNNNIALIKHGGPVVRLPEDKVYRDILSWKVTWLDEQERSKESPPVTMGMPLSVNLPDYKDYESYKSVFYPLMLLELWATMYSDYKGKGQKEAMEFRSPGLTAFHASIDKLEITQICPLVPSDKPRTAEDGFKWHVLTCTVLAETISEINRGCDFGSVSIDFKTTSGKKENKEYFAFFLDGDGQFDPINANSIIPPYFQNKVGKKKYKYTFRVVAKLTYSQDYIIQTEGAYLKKFCYIQSKLRDFKALSLLPTTKLFQYILSPKLYSKNEVFNPKQRVPPASLALKVSEMLNPTQQHVVHFISNGIITKPDPEIFLLHGPPGTGKTKTIVGLIIQLLKSVKGGNRPKLLVCTPSNTALDEIILRLEAEDIDNICNFVRIGNSASEATKKYTLEAKSKTYSQNAGHVATLQEWVDNMESKIKYGEDQLKILKSYPGKNKTEIVALEKETSEYRQKKVKYKKDLDTIQKAKCGSGQSQAKLFEDVDIVFSTLNSCANSVLKRHFGSKLKQQKQSTASMRNQRTYLSFTCCIVDEATQTTEPESLAPLMLGVDKLILCGDPKQLPATVLSKEAELRDYKQSLFHRMYNFYLNLNNQELNPVMMLDIQYRMHPDILFWPNLFFYKGKLKTDNSVTVNCRDIKVKPYLFINVASKESKIENGYNNKELDRFLNKISEISLTYRSVSNDTEVKVVYEILASLHQLRHKPGHRDLSVGIITPYNEQKRKIRTILRETSKNTPAFQEFVKKIEVDTVDSFQGREKDIMILSCVRTNDLGFLKTPERLNVALTRAKKAQIILGNSLCLTSDTGWKDLMDDATRRGCYLCIPENVANELGKECSLRKWIEDNILIK